MRWTSPRGDFSSCGAHRLSKCGSCQYEPRNGFGANMPGQKPVRRQMGRVPERMTSRAPAPCLEEHPIPSRLPHKRQAGAFSVTTCRLACPSAAALCVLLVAGMILCQAHCLWQLDAWSEPQEPAQLREDEDAVFAARAARIEAASDWIAGRSTLAETVERFRVIHAQLPTRL